MQCDAMQKKVIFSAWTRETRTDCSSRKDAEERVNLKGSEYLSVTSQTHPRVDLQIVPTIRDCCPVLDSFAPFEGLQPRYTTT